jgi:hypothetical protein
MARMRVAIINHTTSTKTIVEMPDDVPMNRLIPALVSRLDLPVRQGGNPISYRLDNPGTGVRLEDDVTLAEAGVEADEALYLVPEVTAGGE